VSPRPVRVDFDGHDRAVIRGEAQRRQEVNRTNHALPRNGGPGADRAGYRAQLLGCAGEWAVAKHLGVTPAVFLDDAPIRGSADLPGRIDVKTRSRHNYDLIVQLDDTSDKRYVLVTIENKEVLIRGWIDAVDARLPHYHADPAGGRPAYFVPVAALNPIDTLP
jgi:hypothetical protein